MPALRCFAPLTSRLVLGWALALGLGTTAFAQTAKPKATAEDVALFQLRTACADAAAKAFAAMGTPEGPRRDGDGNQTLTGYDNHYNVERKQCLLRVTSTTLVKEQSKITHSTIFTEIYDALERTTIGMKMETFRDPTLTLDLFIRENEKPKPFMAPADIAWFKSLMDK
jgi:hypothetical protein